MATFYFNVDELDDGEDRILFTTRELQRWDYAHPLPGQKFARVRKSTISLPLGSEAHTPASYFFDRWLNGSQDDPGVIVDFLGEFALPLDSWTYEPMNEDDDVTHVTVKDRRGRKVVSFFATKKTWTTLQSGWRAHFGLHGYPTCVEWRRFEYTEGTSNKFWEISQDKNKYTTRWGKIGTEGSSKVKTWGTEWEATDEAEKLIRSKQRKGYEEVR